MNITRENLRKIVAALIAFLALGLAFYLAAWRSPESVAAIAGEAVALTVIGAVAVGIERIIEAFWAFWEWTGNARNPLGPLSREYRRTVAELEQSLRPLADGAAEMMSSAAKLKKAAGSRAREAKAELKNARKLLEELTPGIRDPDFSKLAREALKQIAALEQKYPQLEGQARAAGMAVDSAVNFVDSFQENPGRRLLSIYFGALLGLILVWITGLDLFQPFLGTDIVRESWGGARLGTAFTGLILGLGSSPTHEVIQILKEIKNSRKNGSR
jgi:hypothetical protein